MDDCLDYEGEDTGKNIGRDFAEGKMTLPVILAFAGADLTKRKALMSEWRAGGGFADILRLLRETGALVKHANAPNKKSALPCKHSSNAPHAKQGIADYAGFFIRRPAGISGGY